MNYEKHISTLLVLKNYFMKNFGYHCPVELVGVIMKFYHKDEWIEICFDKFLKFGNGAFTNILNLGAYIPRQFVLLTT